jgi:photosystem II stability/assembly factor-like uncharacterized protein
MNTFPKVAAFAALAAGTVLLQAQEPAASPALDDLKPRPAEIAPLAAKNLLLGLAQADGQLLAVGDRGTIIRSSDGENWQQSPAPVHATLTAVAFADADNGWAVGHDATILHTTDGGKTWTLQNFQPQDSKPVLSVLALDAQRAYATGAYGMFLATTDGGQTWAQLDAPALLEDGLHLNALIRLNSGELFVTGEIGLAGVSKDGTEWKRLSLPYEGSLFGALPWGEKGALIFGLRGNVLLTDDVHANRWTAVKTGTVHSMFGGAPLPGGGAVLVGADGAILLVGADGKARVVPPIQDEKGLGAGTLSAALPWKDQLLVVGEIGVNRVRLPQN